MGHGKMDWADLALMPDGRTCAPLYADRIQEQDGPFKGEILLFGATENAGRCLRLSWNHTKRNPYSEAWAGALIAYNKPYEWSTVDASGMNFLRFHVKGIAGGEDAAIALVDADNNSSGSLSISDFSEIGKLWKRVIIPLEDLTGGAAEFNLSKLKSVRFGTTGPEGPQTILVDHILLTQKPRGVVARRKTRKAPKLLESTLKLEQCEETVLYAFEKGLQGFGLPSTQEGEEEEQAARDISWQRWTDADEEEDHGRGSLRVDIEVRSNFWQRAMPQVMAYDSDWRPLKALTFEAKLPKDAPEGLAATPFMMFRWWKDWFQAVEQTPLAPGKWTKILLDLTRYDIGPEKLRKVSSMGLFIWGTASGDYKGPVYIDNIRGYSEGELYPKPPLPELIVKKTLRARVSGDASRYGGVVSPHLTSLNIGTDIGPDAELQEQLRGMGTGLFRTWSFGGYGWQLQNPCPEEGVFEWGDFDRLVDAIGSCGWEPLMTLGEFPHWLRPDFEKNSSQEKTRAFRKWAQISAEFVRHFNVERGLGLKRWEIWNETDIDFWEGTEEEYAELAGYASAAMKQVDPTIKIAVAAYASPSALRTHLPKLLKSIDVSKVDAVSFHNYLVPPDYPRDKTMLKIPRVEAAVHRARKTIERVAAEGIPCSHLDVWMTEASLTAETRADPYLQTVFFPVYWGSVLVHYVRMNLRAAVYFLLDGEAFGTVCSRGIRPLYRLWPLLNDKAGIAGKKWCDVDSDQPLLETLVMRDDEHLAILLVNKAGGVAYETDFALKGLPGMHRLDVYRLSDTDNATASSDKVIIEGGKGKTAVPPYTVTVLVGGLSPEARSQELTAFVPEPSQAALGIMVSGQYRFKGQPAPVETAPESVVIDGVLGEYGRCQPVAIGESVQVISGRERWKGAGDAAAEIRLLWNRNAIYVGANVKDDNPLVNQTRQDSRAYDADGLELFIGTRHPLVGRLEKLEWDIQFSLSPGDGAEKKPYVWSYSGGGGLNRRVENAEIAVQRSDTGYTLEARIPTSAFVDLDGFKAGQQLRFDVALDDADDTGKRETQLFWNAKDGTAWMNPDLWGLAVLKGRTQ